MDRGRDDDQETAQEDPILQRVLSDSAYDRVRIERFSHFKQPIPWKLLVQCGLLGVLALTLPLYVFFPAGASEYVPTADPSVASPVVLILGLLALAVELGTAAILVGVALYRVHNEPLTDDQAHSLFTTEAFATYLGFGTGGFATLVVLVLFAVGLGGESAIGAYVQAVDANPFRSSGTGLTVDAFATLALTGMLAVLLAQAYIKSRFAALDLL